MATISKKTAPTMPQTNNGPTEDFSSLINHIITEQEGSTNALRDLLMFMWMNETTYSVDEVKKVFNASTKDQPTIIRTKLELSDKYRKLVNDAAKAKQAKDKDLSKYIGNKLRSAEAAYRDCLSAVYALRSKRGETALKATDVRVTASGLVQYIDESGEAHKLSASALCSKGKAHVGKVHPRREQSAATPKVSGATVEMLTAAIVNIRAATEKKQPVRMLAGNVGPLYAMLTAALLENMRLERSVGDVETRIRVLDAVPYRELVKELNEDAASVADTFKAKSVA